MDGSSHGEPAGAKERISSDRAPNSQVTRTAVRVRVRVTASAARSRGGGRAPETRALGSPEAREAGGAAKRFPDPFSGPRERMSVRPPSRADGRYFSARTGDTARRAWRRGIEAAARIPAAAARRARSYASERAGPLQGPGATRASRRSGAGPVQQRYESPARARPRPLGGPAVWKLAKALAV